MRMDKFVVCVGVLLFVGVSALGSHIQPTPSRDAFWEEFRTAVINKNKTAVASLTKFPVSMPYGMGTVRSKAQLFKRYRDVFNHEGDAAICFADAKPQIDPARPKEFSIGCKNAAGDEVVIYLFVLTKNGWRFTSLDNINE